MKAIQHLRMTVAGLMVLLAASSAFAQTKANLSSPKASTSKVPVVSAAQPGVSLSPGEILSIANSTSATDMTSWSNKFVGGVVSNDKSSEALQKYAEERIAKEVYGNDGPSEIGITYTSQPVAVAYNKYIAPNVQLFFQMNDEIYEGKFYKKLIAAKIVELLSNAAPKNNAYLTPGSLDKLKAELMTEFENDDFPEDAKQTEYFRDRLKNVFERTKTSLTSCAFNNNPICKDDFSSSFFFMVNQSARNICVLAVIIGKSNVDTIKNKSSLTTGLYSAKWGTLFRPLTSYMNQPSAFGVYVTNVKKIQEMTSKGSLYMLYDTDNKSVSSFAFGPTVSSYVRTATVFNTLK